MPLSLRELSTGLFLLEGERHTAGLVTTGAGSVLIDPGSDEEMGGDLRAVLGERAADVRYVVATRGGALRAAGAARWPEAVLLYPAPGECPRREGPAIRFSRDALVKLGETSVELIHLGEADQDVLVVNLPRRRVVFAGSVLPAADARVRGLVMGRLAGLDARLAVPARGAPEPVDEPAAPALDGGEGRGRVAHLSLLRPEAGVSGRQASSP